ncbi:MAG: hypothetical protein CM15mP120_06120 [Pseudomonadota bacterium]|nr:MAG: hypothetical protein CM15mP120_06120 [Pseudomonadota bacterium]
MASVLAGPLPMAMADCAATSITYSAHRRAESTCRIRQRSIKEIHQFTTLQVASWRKVRLACCWRVAVPWAEQLAVVAPVN